MTLNTQSWYYCAALAIASAAAGVTLVMADAPPTPQICTLATVSERPADTNHE